MGPQERAELEQQHLAAFVAGVKGLPDTVGDKRRPALLREVQEFLTTAKQVRWCQACALLMHLFCISMFMRTVLARVS